MPSKKSKKTPKGSTDPHSLWRVERISDEAGLRNLIREWIPLLGAEDVVLLEGEMGAGKSTFARAVLQELGVERPPEGSPTFAIMHEYNAVGYPRIVHVDLYRLEDESELQDTGIEAALWEDRAFALLEWAERFPQLYTGTLGRGRVLWRVKIGFSMQDAAFRSIVIDQLSER